MWEGTFQRRREKNTDSGIRVLSIDGTDDLCVWDTLVCCWDTPVLFCEERTKKSVSLMVVTWLILPVVICLSQRLSHACLSVNNSYETANGSLNQLSFIWWSLTTWITVVILELIHAQRPDSRRAVFIRFKADLVLVIHNNFSNLMPLWWRWFIQISALSTFDGRIEAYHGFNGWRRIRVRFRRGSLRDGYHIQGRQQARKLPNPDSGR